MSIPADPRGFEVAVHDRLATFEALEPAWVALHARSIGRAPHTSYRWLRACWRRQEGSRARRLHIVTVQHEGRLVLVLPLCARRLPFGFHTLSLIDSGTPFYGDVLVEESAAGREAARLVGARLAGDVRLLKARFNSVPDDAALGLLRGSGRWYARARLSVGELELRAYATPEAFLAALPKGFQRDFKTCVRALAREDGRVWRPATPEAAAPVLDWIFATKGAQLAARGTLGDWFAAPATRALFGEALEAGLADGSAVLLAVAFGERLAAAELGFRGGDTLYLSKGAYDPAFGRYSPGTYVRLRLMAELMAEGVTRVDFMLGDYPWKTRLRSGTRGVVHHRLEGPLLAWAKRAGSRP